MVMGRHQRRRLRRLQFGGCRLEIYDRDDQLGKGRCVSLYVKRAEVLRFDFFPGREHYHRRRERGQPRHYFPSGLAFHDYVELACTELVADGRVPAHALEWTRAELGRHG